MIIFKLTSLSGIPTVCWYLIKRILRKRLESSKCRTEQEIQTGEKKMLEGSCQSQALNVVRLCEDSKIQMLCNYNYNYITIITTITGELWVMGELGSKRSALSAHGHNCYVLLGMGHAWGYQNTLQIPTSCRSLRESRAGASFLTSPHPWKNSELQELLSEVQEGAEEWGFGPPVLNLLGGPRDLSPCCIHQRCHWSESQVLI